MRMTFTRREFLRAGGMSLIAVPLLGERILTAVADPSPGYGIEIIPREEWAGSRDPTGALSPEEVRFLLVHHTASGNDYSADDVPGLLRGFYDFHTSDRGWPDVAYNFLIDRYGRVWEGRAGSIDGPVAADATGGSQGFAQLCSLIGDFSTEPPTQEALQSLVGVLAWMADRYDVNTQPQTTVSFVSRGSNRWVAGTEVTTSTIAGHRDMSLTECPGDELYAYVTGGLMADVSALRPSAAPASSTTNVTSTTVTTTTVASTSTTTGVVPSTTSSIAPPQAASPTADTPIPVAAERADSSEGSDLPRALIGVGLAAAVVASAAAARRASNDYRDSDSG